MSNQPASSLRPCTPGSHQYTAPKGMLCPLQGPVLHAEVRSHLSAEEMQGRWGGRRMQRGAVTAQGTAVEYNTCCHCCSHALDAQHVGACWAVRHVRWPTSTVTAWTSPVQCCRPQRAQCAGARGLLPGLCGCRGALPLPSDFRPPEPPLQQFQHAEGLGDARLRAAAAAVSMPSVQERVGFEARAMALEHRHCPEHTPALHHYDARQALLVMRYLEPPHIILRSCLALPAAQQQPLKRPADAVARAAACHALSRVMALRTSAAADNACLLLTRQTHALNAPAADPLHPGI